MNLPRFLLAALLLLPAPRTASAAEGDGEKKPEAPVLMLSRVVSKLKLGGDATFRHEDVWRPAPSYDQSRGRYRLRLAAEATLPWNLGLAMRLASGTGSQVSTFQTYGKLAGQKGVSIDQLYGYWAPAVGSIGRARLSAGKMENQFWRVNSSDLVWDPDVNPEGYQQSLELSLPCGGAKVFANALQMMVDEDTSTAKNRWLFSGQLGTDLALPAGAGLRVAASYHKWSGENGASFGQPTVLSGNRRSGTALLNRFGTGELTGQLSAKFGGVPAALQGTLARNLRARTDLAGPRARDGYQYGFILGKASKARTWEVAGFKKYSQTDVTAADIADSEFGEGGTNRKGYISWVAFSPSDWLRLSAKFYITGVIDRGLNGSSDAYSRRLQFDAMFKF